MHEQVKGFLSKCTVLKADLLQDIKYTVCYRTIKHTVWRRVYVHFSARKFYRLGQ